ncbi:hypothetical protein SAE02_61500 [Skermanella aerolata]|uniref:Uncharacterized protein n=1 Tax=Skermanella aerolata TaxID=393310 RepID=A0A512DZX5_9PROT|nr:hypothetical protein [Skermanella aerolata]KJB91891.1 hypothetical protein N826_25580 [Skermanella aerolata KACC 11604]GEO42002.1 hypothetical protein SAE02_61500 [Skermanella aerolata]
MLLGDVLAIPLGIIGILMTVLGAIGCSYYAIGYARLAREWRRMKRTRCGARHPGCGS